MEIKITGFALLGDIDIFRFLPRARLYTRYRVSISKIG